MKTKFFLRLLTLSTLICALQAQTINALAPNPNAGAAATAAAAVAKTEAEDDNQLLLEHKQSLDKSCPNNAKNAFNSCTEPCSGTCQTGLSAFWACMRKCNPAGDPTGGATASGCYSDCGNKFATACSECSNCGSQYASAYTTCLQ